MDILTDEMILAWLRERQANALRISRIKQGEDRKGWLEDVAYFKHSADAILYYKAAYQRTLNDKGDLLRQLAVKRWTP